MLKRRRVDSLTFSILGMMKKKKKDGLVDFDLNFIFIGTLKIEFNHAGSG